jgi:hypothetical protein
LLLFDAKLAGCAAPAIQYVLFANLPG